MDKAAAALLLKLFDGALTGPEAMAAARSVVPCVGSAEGGSLASPWSPAELAAWAAASPTRLLRLQHLLRDGTGAPAEAATWPPTIVLHATDDKTVPVSSARDFVGALAEAHGEEAVTFCEYAEAGHGEVMLNLMGPTDLAELPGADAARIALDFVRCCSGRDGEA